MELEGAEPRRKKSNFDVPPSEIVTEELLNNTDLSKKRKKSNFDVLPTVQASAFEQLNETLLKFGGNAIILTNDQIPITIPQDTQFKLRLSNSLQKNFDYIARKDSGILEKAPKKDNTIKFVNATTSKSKSNLLNAQINRPGIGSAPIVNVSNTRIIQQQLQLQQQQQLSEILSVYITGLPTDITDEEIEILFTRQGKPKKIKLYTNTDGSKKGDALVTFTKSECVTSACQQFNGRDIGEGCVLTVTPADFSYKTQSQTQSSGGSSSQTTISDHNMLSNTSSTSTSSSTYLHSVKMSADEISSQQQQQQQPFQQQRDAYTSSASTSTSSYSALLPPEYLLQECCIHGKVIRIMSLEGSSCSSSTTTTSNNDSNIGDQLSLEGTIAITFENIEAARRCASSLHGRWFDARQLEAQVVTREESTDNMSTSISMSDTLQMPSTTTQNITTATATAAIVFAGTTSSVIQSLSMYDETGGSATLRNDDDDGSGYAQCDTVAVENDVEDFLNSLL
eukprot:gene8436-17395_t